MKKLILVIGLMFCCSCSSMYAAKTEVTIYDPSTGSVIADIFNNKSYQGLHWNVEKRTDGTVSITYDAEVTDANSIAAAALKGQAATVEVLKGVVGVVK